MVRSEATRQPVLTTIALVVALIGIVAHTAALVPAPASDPVAAKRDRHARHCGATPIARPCDPHLDYDQRRASDDIRAYHGAIFFARVDALEDENEEASGGTAPPHLVQHYLATVDRSLVGSASGQGPIVYFGAYENSFESAGFGPLRIGERYLFFAGGDRAGTECSVEAGTGAILITCDQQEEQLVEKYLSLIAEAEKHEQEVKANLRAWDEARQARSGLTPVATIDPDHGPARTRVTVTGKGFNFEEAMIAFGHRRTFVDGAVEDGSFVAQIGIPKDAPRGPFTITVDDEQGFTADLTFTVTA